MSEAETETAHERRKRFLRMRTGQFLGLLFLIAPLSDLPDASLSTARLVAISVLTGVFVALWLALLPPVSPIARRGPSGIVAGLALLAVIAGVILALGGPAAFTGLYVYVVAAAGLLLPSRAAIWVIGITTVAVGFGLAAAGAARRLRGTPAHLP